MMPVRISLKEGCIFTGTSRMSKVTRRGMQIALLRTELNNCFTALRSHNLKVMISYTNGE